MPGCFHTTKIPAKPEEPTAIAHYAGLFSLTPTPSEPSEEPNVIALCAGLFSLSPAPSEEPKMITRYS